MKKKQSKGGVWPPLLFIGMLLFASYILGTTLGAKSAVDKSEQYNINSSQSFQKQGTVQLGTVDLIQNTPTPPPPTAVPTAAADLCNHDMSKKADPEKCFCTGAWMIRCESNTCKEINYSKSGGGSTYTCAQVDASGWCGIFSKEGDGWYCIGKPVIYLYPEKDMLVDVTVKTAGEVFVSDPQIEYMDKPGSTTQSEGGWTDVLAHPDGTLLYQSKKYRELFYESQTRELNRPKAGIVMTRQNLKSELLSFITQLGLTRHDEQKEFLDWWVPQLEKIQTDKIFVSILEKDEKKRLDEVFISPKPDTFIEFIVFFAPLSDNEKVTPLVLPPTPKRIGFTAIEWGGVIAK